jgi:DNA replication and repair protein RecF
MLVGENGAGKSTFCEAMMIALNAENPHHTNWSEKTTFGTADWSIRLQEDEEFHSVVYDGVTKSPKWYYRDQSTSRPKYSASLPSCALWIQSDHLRVISGEPGERRGFLDDMLASADIHYGHLLKNYRNAISQRNKVIQDIQEGLLNRRDIASWNTLLAQSAVPLILQRRKMFAWIARLPDQSLHLPGPTRVVLIERHPLQEVTVESFLNLLKEYEDRDIIVGKTTIGPQLDDIEFSVCINAEFKAARYTLSRGENKTLLLSFIKKIGMYIQSISGKVPFFLLDDVLSELDEAHITALLEIF